MSEDPRIQYKFMIPASMKQRLEDAAHENRRSLSAEIISRLDISLELDSMGSYVPGPNVHSDDSVERVTLLLNEALAIVSRYKKVLGEE